MANSLAGVRTRGLWQESGRKTSTLTASSEGLRGSSNEDLVGSILEMYDLLIGRSSELKEDVVKSQRRAGFDKPETSLEATKTRNSREDAGSDNKKNKADNWCDVIKQNWNCRCIEKSAIEAVTRCSACNVKESRSSVIGKGQAWKSEVLSPSCQSEPSLSPLRSECPSKCELVTCPAGLSTPSTPVQRRFGRLGTQLPLSLRRRESYFRWAARPSSVSSLASSSSSSSSSSLSGSVNSWYGPRRFGTSGKSSTHLASIESLEDDSDTEREDQKDKSSSFSKETEGSEDSGVHSLCPSLPQDSPKYCDPHLSYMDKVVTEIIETEEVYVGDLRSIIEGYLEEWRSVKEFPLRDRVETLFGNIETVFSFNSSFLKELKQCGLDPVKVAKCFVKNNSGFSVYTEYCTNYPKTVSLLTELMRQEGAVRLFRERQAALQHTLPLGSYLLKPVQRILKYHLLLENIVKQYSDGVDGHRDIEDALRTMTEIAQHINDMKRRHEHEVRVQEIQSLLLGWQGEDLTTFGELCAEGALRLYGAKALRHVFLFDKMLLITKKKEGGTLDYKTHINCSNLMLIESVPGEPLSFHVIPFDNPRSQYTLQCRSLDQKREWTWQIKRVILENYNAVIPSHARQLVMELGRNKTEDGVQTNKILPKRNHLAPEYLEKRKQEREKTDSGSKSRMRKNRNSEAGLRLEDQQGESEAVERQKQVEKRLDGTESETEATKVLENKDPSSSSSEKVEMKTLEQIVTQILKQNREFDKILKRQKHIISKSRDSSSKRRKKREASSRDGRTVRDTLKSFKFFRNSREETFQGATEEDCSVDFCCSKLADEDLSAIDGTSESPAVTAQQMTLDEGIPTSPSVWLRQQVQHLPIAPKKAGSLPRSFQVTSASTQVDSNFFRDFRVSLGRPFTIASDKISSTMLFEGMERLYRGQFCRSISNATDEGSLTEELRTPGESLDHINIHPEYKIYRSDLPANILKGVLSSVQSKLAHFKVDDKCKSQAERKALTRDRRASRMMYMLAKHYHKSLRMRQKGKCYESGPGSYRQLTLSCGSLPVYKQGSEGLGARLANFKESECRIRCSKKAAAFLGVCADSVLPVRSSPESPSSQNFSPQEKSDQNQVFPEYEKNSDESFPENSFEQLEKEMSQMKLQSDQECADSQTNFQTPPPVLPKPRKELIEEKMAERLRDEMKEREELQESSSEKTRCEI